jgi:hypothetical protein
MATKLDTSALDKSFDTIIAKATTASRIPTQEEYERRERDEVRKKEREVEEAPLRDRKEAQAEFLDAMANRPDIIEERLGWLFDGNYGWGAMTVAKEILNYKGRTNKEAILTHMIGVHEWQCPARMAADAWKKLTAAQKKKLDAAVRRAMKEALKEEE